MAGTLINDYSNSDSNILAVQSTLDKTFFGKIDSITLTEFDSSTVPAIAAGSVVENNGAIYSFSSEESISLTDPVTSATVADGTVYVCLVPGTGTITAAFTATAPTWSDSKQGFYGTGGQANYRYLPYYATKASTSYTDKHFFPLKQNADYAIPLKNPVKSLVAARLTNTQTGDSTDQDLIFGNVTGFTEIDVNNEYNAATGEFTASKNGYYKFTCNCDFNWNASTTISQFQMNIDDGGGYSTFSGVLLQGASGITQMSSIIEIANLEIGNKIKFSFKGNSNTSALGGSVYDSTLLVEELSTTY